MQYINDSMIIDVIKANNENRRKIKRPTSFLTHFGEGHISTPNLVLRLPMWREFHPLELNFPDTSHVHVVPEVHHPHLAKLEKFYEFDLEANHA